MAERMRELKISRPYLYPQEAANLIAFLYTLNYFDRPGKLEAGRRLFVEKGCVVCHQVGGVGGVIGPNLDFLKQYGSPIFVATAMWNHGPAMAEAMQARGIKRPTFTGSELNDLTAYLKSASPAQTDEPLYVLPGDAETGRRLFVEKNCRVCHTVGGKGGRVGPDLSERGVHRSLTEFAAAMWNKAPAMIKAMREGGIPVPQVEPQEMADLVAYLYSVRYFSGPGDARRGEKVVKAKGCLRCHSVRGQGGTSASDLARSKWLLPPAAVVSVMWNHALDMQDQPETQERAWPELRPEEMADLVAYLQRLRQDR
jgi:mono/diheme cytochrome c family protein